ncbi:hypothetical protein SSCH_2560001 [Syntrophaceticus schinkii]|uniref:Uncharacterized protein n=1 Tax=Syntrophaceticus schinkii TaxID=499207 RepID=A0A0B7MKS1_9FIRM|nr:hypothetical protein SSCH_2560001 [Syntrophaceticus schinkii]
MLSGKRWELNFTNKRLTLGGDKKKFWLKPKNKVLHYIFVTKSKDRYPMCIKGLRPFICHFGVKVRM